MKGLYDLISTYKDFPKKGIDFKDVLEIIQDPNIFRELIIKMSSSEILKNTEAIISIDARGFIFGSAIAFYSSMPMITARKPGKLPGEIVEQKYHLEYGNSSLSIQKKSLEKYNSYIIVDDLLATGGTAAAATELLRNAGGLVTRAAFVIDLPELGGREKLAERSVDVSALMNFAGA